MLPEIQLVYDRDCPNVAAAREVLSQAMHRCGLDPRWVEYERNQQALPVEYLGYGSPTILIDGVDSIGEAPMGSGGRRCRLYPCGSRIQGVPSVETVVAAIERAANARRAPSMDPSGRS